MGITLIRLAYFWCHGCCSSGCHRIFVTQDLDRLAIAMLRKIGGPPGGPNARPQTALQQRTLLLYSHVASFTQNIALALTFLLL